MPQIDSGKAIVGYGPGEITAKGAVTIEIIVPVGPLNAIINAQYMDSKNMSQRPGMISKYMPYRYDEISGKLATGGSYLFDTWDDAKEYVRWASDDYRTGEAQLKFFENPMFESHRAWTWKVVGGHSFKAMEEHAVGRLQQWHYSGEHAEAGLTAAYPAIKSAAEAQGVSTVWLLHNPDQKTVAIQLVFGKKGGDGHQSAQRSLDVVSEKPLLENFLPKSLELTPLYERTGLHLAVWLPKSRAAGGTEIYIPFHPVVPDISLDYV